MFSDHEIAAMAHELHRAYSQVIGDQWVEPSWHGQPRWYQEAVADGVAAARRGLTRRQLHENWCTYYLALGWRYGPDKDRAEKTHPNLVSWDALPPEQRLKDVIFARVVRLLSGLDPADAT